MGAPKGNKNAIGNKGGGSTKFKPEYAEDLVEFFDIEPFKKEVMESTTEYYANGEIKKASEKFRLLPAKMPTLYRFSKKINVTYTTLYRWAEKGQYSEDEKEKPTPEFVEFRNAYKEAKELQKEFLINIGLSGSAPSPFAIFTAKNVTDMRDKQEQEITGNLTVNVQRFSDES